ncbi:MAG TPA: arginine--tRNA ligase, partial [Cytophagaceae bacterium]
MNLESDLKTTIVQALKESFQIEYDVDQILLQPTRDEFEGSFTYVTFPITKLSKKSPEETGRLIGEFLVSHNNTVKSYNVVKGFLNIDLKDTTWLELFYGDVVPSEYGQSPANGKKVLVEYSSPNTNKPLHLGHLRNNFLGYAVSNILKANGYEVSKVNLVNDRGIHICKSMLAYQKFGNGETPASSGLKGDHLIGKYYVIFDKEYKKQIESLKQKGLDEDHAKKAAGLIIEAQEMLVRWENKDEKVWELWSKMNGWVYEGFNETYKNIGVDFDKYYYESQTYLLGKGLVEEGLEKKAFYKKDDGSVWVDLTEDGLDEKLLLRGDGTSVYITQDLGTAELKYQDFGAEQSIYVVGNEQDYHFKVLQLILKKLKKKYAEGIYHLSYGMVDLPSGKMKSREGTVVDADELVQEMVDTAEHHTKELGKIDGFTEPEAKALYQTLGLGALKYFLLKVDPKKRMLFNPQESIEFQGNTGPFIQYTYARIAAILRKATLMGIDYQKKASNKTSDLHVTEKNLIVTMSKYPTVLKEAAKGFSPSLIAQYVYDLAKAYNRFYAEVSIFNEDNKQELEFRIILS